MSGFVEPSKLSSSNSRQVGQPSSATPAAATELTTVAAVAQSPPPGQFDEVVPGVLWTQLPLGGKLDHVNVYLLESSEGWTLVDTGTATAACRDALTTALDSVVSASMRLRRVIVTHFHPDHIGLAGWLVEGGARLWTTKATWLSARLLTLEHMLNTSPLAPTPLAPDRIVARPTGADPADAATTFLTRAGLSDLEIARIERSGGRSYGDLVGRVPNTYRRIRDGDQVQIGPRRWHVLTADGHATEHATLWSDDGLAIVGDQILPSTSANLSIHPSEPETDPVSEWLGSCQRLGTRATSETIGLPGHGLPFRGIPKRCQQLSAIQNHISQRLLDFLARPRTAVECVGVVYMRDLGTHEFSLLLSETVGLLNHLLHQGLVSRNLVGRAFRWHRSAVPTPHLRERTVGERFRADRTVTLQPKSAQPKSIDDP